MKAPFKKIFLTSILIMSFTPIGYANNVIQQHANGEEGQLIYHVKYDYDAICKVLGITQKVYDQYWKEGLSIVDMAKKEGIERREIESYFIAFHYQEMQKWRKKGAMNEHHYFNLVYELKDQIKDFIERNPNKE
ncbi:hypothetical protein AMS59_02395 [Lysinibacillus sp. FJAT-14745]|uniref:hypothetical protein n=1 Tax=Lysinibacillus sp. FJAT-14745 TaxID=1704289 RepID=UPI0006AB78D6|nr:hypothetical protein [Lysinibacillus sp. FJAT-14745]KOP80267.1 hypothetical protein AMS59_02395 [Lysinibacillus sp. FJAT-14745]